MSSSIHSLVYQARKRGYRIDTPNRTVYISNEQEFMDCKTIMRLINLYGFAVQYLDKSLSIDLPDQKFYISLPINSMNPATRLPYDIRAQRAVALRVQKYLTSLGCRCFNPFRNGLDPDSPVSEHMRADYRGLADCTSIVFLPGWQYSNGCKHEFLMASDLRLRMYLLDTSSDNLSLRPF